jgi:hypothetical protein
VLSFIWTILLALSFVTTIWIMGGVSRLWTQMILYDVHS